MTDQRYTYEDHGWGVCRGWRILDLNGRSMDGAPYFVDKLQTRSAAEYACRLLNQGLARVNDHAIIGCRVEAIV